MRHDQAESRSDRKNSHTTVWQCEKTAPNTLFLACLFILQAYWHSEFDQQTVSSLKIVPEHSLMAYCVWDWQMALWLHVIVPSKQFWSQWLDRLFKFLLWVTFLLIPVCSWYCIPESPSHMAWKMQPSSHLSVPVAVGVLYVSVSTVPLYVSSLLKRFFFFLHNLFDRTVNFCLFLGHFVPEPLCRRLYKLLCIIWT